MTATVYSLVSACMTLTASAEPDPSVTAGGKALDQWWWRSYPWYNSANDSVEPIDVSEPWYMKWDWPTWSGTAPGLGNMSWLQWAAWIGIGLLLIVLLYLMFRVYRSRERRREKAQSAGAGSDAGEDRRRVEALPVGTRRGRFDLLAEARRHYHKGNYKEAIIYLFGHQLLQLDKHNYIRLTKGKTNRQYIRELGQRMTLRRLVQETMVAFEDVFFGDHAIDRARFESCWSRLDEFDSLVTGGGS